MLSDLGDNGAQELGDDGPVKKGDKVELTDEGKRVMPIRTYRKKGKTVTTMTTGVVVGYCREQAHIRILRDGTVYPEAYHKTFWKKVE